MKVNRIRKIEELLMDMHSLSIDYLCEYFNVSKNTIRRDIAEMDKNGSIKKVYGGIVLNDTKEDRKSTCLNSSHESESRMPSSA